MLQEASARRNGHWRSEVQCLEWWFYLFLSVLCSTKVCSWTGMKLWSPPWGGGTLDARWQALEWNGRITQNMAEIACFQKIPIMLWLSADDAFGSKRCAICSYPKELADQRPADKTRLTVVLLEWIIVEDVLVPLSSALLNNGVDNCEPGGFDTQIPEFFKGGSGYWCLGGCVPVARILREMHEWLGHL